MADAGRPSLLPKPAAQLSDGPPGEQPRGSRLDMAVMRSRKVQRSAKTKDMDGSRVKATLTTGSIHRMDRGNKYLLSAISTLLVPESSDNQEARVRLTPPAHLLLLFAPSGWHQPAGGPAGSKLKNGGANPPGVPSKGCLAASNKRLEHTEIASRQHACGFVTTSFPTGVYLVCRRRDVPYTYRSESYGQPQKTEDARSGHWNLIN